MSGLSSSSDDGDLNLGTLKQSLSLNTVHSFSSSSDDEAPFEPVQWKSPEERNSQGVNELQPGTRFEQSDLEDGANTIMEILVPVCITMVFVIFVVKFVTFPYTNAASIVMVYQEEAADTGVTKFFGALLNAAIFVVMIVVVTCVFVALYYYRCMNIIFGWLILSTVTLFAFMGGYVFFEILNAANIPMDYITFAFLLWNFSICGILSIFWHAPLKVNQGFLIFISAIMAILFTKLPEWTTWAVLAAIAIYDLFAVLCPRGPLRVLVETAQERNESIPALIYSASIWMMMAGSTSSSSSSGEGGRRGIGRSLGLDRGNQPRNNNGDAGVGVGIGDDDEPENQDDNQNQPQPQQAIELEPQDPDTAGDVSPDAIEDLTPQRRGVKLGLGDFVFYSVLVGRAALFDMLTVGTAFIGIVTGLFCTIMLLAVWKQALPALPISIFFGMIFYFWTKLSLLALTSDFIAGGIAI